MADSPVGGLTRAESVGNLDLFVLEQSGVAKSLEGQTLINDLAAALDGHGNVADISYTPPASGSVEGTLTITMVDETEYELTITNGRGITGITWATSGTAGDGMTHTGTIAYNDGTTSSVQFQDGVKGDQGQQTYVWFKWAQDYPTQDSDISGTAGPYIGIYTGTSSTAPSTYTSYTWYKYKGDKGDTGSSIASIALTSTTGLVDLYTITMTDGNTSTFTVTNAKSIVSVTMTSGSHAAGTSDVYTILFNDGDTAQFSVYNGANGLGSVSTVSGIQADGNGDVPQVISGNGAPTTATVGQTNQLYYDLTNSVLYYCAGESGGTYVWLGAGVTVDSALSGSSENPVQNKVITNRIGTGALPRSATDLTGAITAVNNAIPSSSTSTPNADGTGAAGSSSAFSKSDHVHPLNVPTSGVPADLGTAALGSAATYARSDHVHAMPSASDVGAVSTSDVQYKIYDSVTDLGLTSGSATIAGAYAAMSDGSILITTNGDFASGECPDNGTVEIHKISAYRGIVLFYGATTSHGDYRMFLNSSYAPSGTWVRSDLYAETGTVTPKQGVSMTSGYLKRSGNVAYLVVQFTGVNISTSSLATIATINKFMPSENVVTTGLVGFGSTCYLDVTGTGDIRVRGATAQTSVAVRASLTWILG